MAFISVPINNKPRKLSKKKKEQMAKEKEASKKKAKEKKEYWKKAPTHVASSPYIPDRNAHLKIGNGPSANVQKSSQIIETELSEEMIERERLAQLRSEAMKKMTAPLYSKGPYQYVGEDPEIIKNLGKKV